MRPNGPLQGAKAGTGATNPRTMERPCKSGSLTKSYSAWHYPVGGCAFLFFGLGPIASGIHSLFIRGNNLYFPVGYLVAGPVLVQIGARWALRGWRFEMMGPSASEVTSWPPGNGEGPRSPRRGAVATRIAANVVVSSSGPPGLESDETRDPW